MRILSLGSLSQSPFQRRTLLRARRAGRAAPARPTVGHERSPAPLIVFQGRRAADTASAMPPDAASVAARAVAWYDGASRRHGGTALAFRARGAPGRQVRALLRRDAERTSRERPSSRRSFSSCPRRTRRFVKPRPVPTRPAVTKILDAAFDITLACAIGTFAMRSPSSMPSTRPRTRAWRRDSERWLASHLAAADYDSSMPGPAAVVAAVVAGLPDTPTAAEIAGEDSAAAEGEERRLL